MPVVNGIKIRRLKKEAPAKKWIQYDLKLLAEKPRLRLPGAFDGKMTAGPSRCLRLKCVLCRAGGLYGVEVGGTNTRTIYWKATAYRCWSPVQDVLVLTSNSKSKRR